METLKDIPDDIWGLISEFCPASFAKMDCIGFASKATKLALCDQLPASLVDSTTMRSIEFMSIFPMHQHKGIMPRLLREITVLNSHMYGPRRETLAALPQGLQRLCIADCKIRFKDLDSLPPQLEYLEAKVIEIPDRIEQSPSEAQLPTTIRGIQTMKIIADSKYGPKTGRVPYLVHIHVLEKLSGRGMSVPEDLMSFSTYLYQGDSLPQANFMKLGVEAPYGNGLIDMDIFDNVSRNLSVLNTYPPLLCCQDTLDRFPNLAEMNVTIKDNSSPKLLPRGLTKLSLYLDELTADIAAMLPRGITDLTLVYNAHELSQDVLRNLPPLKKLALPEGCRSIDNSEHLRSVRELVIDDSSIPNYTFLRSMSRLRYFKMGEPSNEPHNLDHMFAMLPASLETLILDFKYDITLDNVRNLPPGLTHLEVIGFKTVSKKMRLALPRGLLLLKTRDDKFLRDVGIPVDVRFI